MTKTKPKRTYEMRLNKRYQPEIYKYIEEIYLKEYNRIFMKLFKLYTMYKLQEAQRYKENLQKYLLENNKTEKDLTIREIEKIKNLEDNYRKTFNNELQTSTMKTENILKRQYSGIIKEVEDLYTLKYAEETYVLGNLNKKKKRLGKKINELEGLLTYQRTVLGIKLPKDKKQIKPSKSKEQKYTKKYKDYSKSNLLNDYLNNKTKLFWTKRKYFSTKLKAEKYQERQDKGAIKICFGTRKLFQSQYTLYENNHKEWLELWRNKRQNRIFLRGESDKVFGNEVLQYSIETGELKLRILPKDEQEYSKKGLKGKYSRGYLKEGGLKLNYINHIKLKKLKPTELTEYLEIINTKKARSYRIIKKKNGLYLQMIIDDVPNNYTKERLYSQINGVIGLDLNYNFMAKAYISKAPTNPKDIITMVDKLKTSNKTSTQTQDMIGKYCNNLVNEALKLNYGIVIEDLKFAEEDKYTSTKSRNVRRKTHRIPYKEFRNQLEAIAKNKGVPVLAVNPMYTSMIGQMVYMKEKGITGHESASIVIGHRGLLVIEKYIAVVNLTKQINKETLAGKPAKNLSKLSNDLKKNIEITSIYREEIPNYVKAYAKRKNLTEEQDLNKNWIQICKTLKKDYSVSKRIALLYKANI